MKINRLRRTAAMACVAACALAMADTALGVGDVVISQVWGGSSSATGTATLPKADYIELFNRTANPVSLNGWSINVDTSTGTSWTKHDLPNVSIPAFSYYLIQVSATSTAGVDLPTPDTTFAAPTFTELSSTSGKVALRRTTTAIGAVNCPPTDANLADLVTYGTTGTCFEGAGRAPAGSATGTGLAIFRAAGGCTDTDDNAADFATAIPAPRNSATASPGGCTTGACCNDSTGVCGIVLGIANCPSGSTYHGDNTTCSPNPCAPSGACCNGSTGSTCTALTSAGCAAILGFYQGNGTVCSPTPCTTGACCFMDGTCCALLSQLCTNQGGTPSAAGVTCTTTGNCVAAVTNNVCSSAITLNAGVAVIGNNFTATTNDGLNTLCSTTRVSKGVWYRFSPLTTSVYDITTCGSTVDCTLGVFRIPNCADTTTWSYVACDDDGCPTGGGASFCGTTANASAALIEDLELIGGTTYYILVAADSTAATAGGNYTLLVQDQGALIVGACCNATTGQCEIRSAVGCAASVPAATYQGDGSTCSANPCGTVVGACCFSGGVCVLRPGTACTGTNVYQGDNSSCAPDPCATVACCNNTSGACTVRLAGACTSSETDQGVDSVCSPSPCPPSGSCCNTCSQACTTTIQTACAGSWTEAGVCSPNPCFGAAPSNDLPCGALTLVPGTPQTALIGGATGGNDGPASSCDATATKGLWYTFTPPSTAYYQISTCGATIDTILTVLTGNCADAANMTILACDDDTCTGNEAVVCGTSASSGSAALINFTLLAGGTPHYIRVQGLSSVTGGSFPILLSSVSVGACCNNSTGICTTGFAAACGAGSTYQGDNTLCTPSPCPASTDLAVTTLTALPATCVNVGANLQTSLRIANNGTIPAHNVVATVIIPPAFGFTGSTPSGSPVNGVLTLNLGTLAAAASVDITLSGIAPGGTGAVSVSVDGTEPDPESANNAVQQNVLVTPAATSALQVLLSDVAGDPTSTLGASGSFPGANIADGAESFSRPFFSPDGTRYIVSIDTDLATTQDRVLVVGNTNPFTAPVVAQEGVTTFSLGDASGEFDYGMGINNAGQYVWSTTTNALSGINDVVVKSSGTDHSVLIREGDAVATIGGAIYNGANSAYAIRANGQASFFATLGGFTTATDTAVFDGDGNTLIGQEGVTFPGNTNQTYGTPFNQLTAGNVGEGMSVSGTTGFTLAANLSDGTDVIVVDGNVVLAEGMSLPGVPDPLTTINYNNQALNGDWLAYGESSGEGIDWCVRNGAVVTKTGDFAYAGGPERWDDGIYAQTFFGFVANGVGEYVVAGTFAIDGVVSTASNAMLVANGTRPLVRENDPVDLNGNGQLDDDTYISTFRDDRMFLANDGWLYFTARLRSAASACSGGTTDNAQAFLRINIRQNGACCAGSSCSVTTAAGCTGVNTSFAGAGTVCNAPGNSTTPCCKADYNHSGSVTVQDIFDFLAGYFTADSKADINGVGGVTVQDIFDFLAAYFAGGC